ncbi:MAG: hypothetical protein KGJ93_05470, partial [Patescibacteria group bacterium]|nr:hypothetical protein [Patescibacteria group bacterium]
MPKKFVLFLSVAQTILSFLHWLLYLMLLHFFPALRPVHTVLLAVVLLCSVSFLLFSTAVHFMGWRILDWGYMLSGSLLVLAGYGFWFLLAALALSSAWPAASTVFAAAALLGSLLMTVYGLINARIIRVRHINVALPNLPEFWRNKTAVAAADIHLGNILREGFARKVVRAINTQRPDIVFLPGDYYDG